MPTGVTLFIDVTTSLVFVNSTQLQVLDGAVGTPSYSFANDTNTGIFRSGADQLVLVIGGVTGIDIASSRTFINTTQLQTLDGLVGTPAYSFANDTDTGFYRIGPNQVGLSLGGTLNFNFATSGMYIPDGSAVLPSYSFQSDPDTGFYRFGSNAIGIATGG